MKRYISAILIPCLLMQFVGCYSFREVTIDELQKYTGPNEVKLITNESEIIIERQLSGDLQIRWEINDSSVVIDSTQLIKEKNTVKPLSKQSRIMLKDINSVEIEEYDNLKTFGLAIGIPLVALVILVAATFDMNFNLGNGAWK
jgi:hypothetical protein